MEIVITLSVITLISWISYTMAKKRNRNVMAWTAVSGLTIPVDGTLLLPVLGDSSKSKEKDREDVR